MRNTTGKLSGTAGFLTARKGTLRAGLVAVLLLLVACSSDTSKAAQELKSASSWAGSVKLTVQQWIEGSLTLAFAENSLSRAHEELAASARKLRAAEPSSAVTGRAADLVSTLQKTVEETSTALSMEDRPRLRASAEALTKVQHAIELEIRALGQ
jgi:hypothetical protein